MLKFGSHEASHHQGVAARVTSDQRRAHLLVQLVWLEDESLVDGHVVLAHLRRPVDGLDPAEQAQARERARSGYRLPIAQAARRISMSHR